ncbi:MAG TPA: ABC transporter permease, partial [Mycobacteriales bacterium]|nr:ABC transporter permease [Mycobacteriales bacterium]
VTTDLSQLGKPGTTFTRDFFLSATLLSFPDDAVAQVATLPGVESAVGGLVQLAQHQTGKVPEIVASIQTGGQTFTQTVRPAPLTEAERAAVEACAAGQRGQAQPRPGASPGGPRPVERRGAFDECLPERFREFRASFTTPVQTLRQLVAPPSTDIKNVSYTAAGVDPSHPEVGLVTADQLVTGRWIAPETPDEILLNVAYANTKSMKVGSTLPINGTSYAVVGLVRPTLTGSTADVYFPVRTLQKLAGKDGRITQVLVKADDADSVDAVAAGIKELLPGAEVVTTQALADQVTGSLSDAQDLASRLGGAFAAIVLASAFIIAVLLTLSSIGKRVREIGTLRAIGWSKGRVVRQLLGETLLIGLAGGVLGIAVGFGVAQIVESASPALSATSSGVPGINSSTLSGLFGQTTTTVQTTRIAVTAPLHGTTLVLGVVFALIGGLLAGLAGGWRAARLSPAVALRNFG